MRARTAAIAAIGLLASFALATPALGQGDPTAETDGTVAVAVRSVTVSQPSFEFDTCSAFGEDTMGKLTFPHGRCDGPALAVTNGESAAHIMVSGTNFQGSSSPEPEWQLCGPNDCQGGGLRGPDEVAVVLGEFADDHIGTDARCHTYWNVEAEGDERCAAAPLQSVEVTPVLLGPASTSNGSPEFTTTITWTALP